MRNNNKKNPLFTICEQKRGPRTESTISRCAWKLIRVCSGEHHDDAAESETGGAAVHFLVILSVKHQTAIGSREYATVSQKHELCLCTMYVSCTDIYISYYGTLFDHPQQCTATIWFYSLLYLHLPTLVALKVFMFKYNLVFLRFSLHLILITSLILESK